jgi:hypothetical protein
MFLLTQVAYMSLPLKYCGAYELKTAGKFDRDSGNHIYAVVSGASVLFVRSATADNIRTQGMTDDGEILVTLADSIACPCVPHSPVPLCL